MIEDDSRSDGDLGQDGNAEGAEDAEGSDRIGGDERAACVDIVDSNEPVERIIVRVNKTAREMGMPSNYKGSILGQEFFSRRSAMLRWMSEMAHEDAERLAMIRMEGANSSEVRAAARDTLDSAVFFIPQKKVKEIGGETQVVHTGVAFEAIALWGVDKLSRIKAVRELRGKGVEGMGRGSIPAVLRGVAEMGANVPGKYKDADIANLGRLSLEVVRNPDDKDVFDEVVRAETTEALKVLQNFGAGRMALVGDPVKHKAYLSKNRDRQVRFELFQVAMASVARGEVIPFDIKEQPASHLVRRLLLDGINGGSNVSECYGAVYGEEFNDDKVAIMDALLDLDCHSLEEMTVAASRLLQDLGGTHEQQILVVEHLEDLGYLRYVLRKVEEAEPEDVVEFIKSLDLPKEE